MENQLHAGSSIWALRSAANEKIGISAVQPDLKAALLKDIVRISVTDDRPGLPGSLRTLVLEPFFKADTARTPANRSGFGLGLSIVDDIVRAHGGTIELLNSAPHGLVARMDLPAAGYPLA